MRNGIVALIAGLFMGMTGSLVHAETELSDPKPDMDNPRQIVLALTTKDEAAVNNLLFNVVNIQKFYGQENVEIAVVGYGAGVRSFLKAESKVAERIQSLQLYDIRFIACGNTLDAIGKERTELLDGIEHVQAGLPEIVERQLRGWIYLRP
mgnify:CR=1 FL=1|jgi:uncharacterized protein